MSEAIEELCSVCDGLGSVNIKQTYVPPLMYGGTVLSGDGYLKWGERCPTCYGWGWVWRKIDDDALFCD